MTQKARLFFVYVLACIGGIVAMSQPVAAFRVWDASRLLPDSTGICPTAGTGWNSETVVDPGRVDVGEPCARVSLNISYWIDRSSIPPNLTLEEVQEGVRKGLRVWEKVKNLQTQITFHELDIAPVPLLDKDDNVMVISWAPTGELNGIAPACCDPETGEWSRGADIYLNESFGPWVTGRIQSPRDGWYLPGVIAHEVGHVLAIGHSADNRAMMWRSRPWWDRLFRRVRLYSDDKAALSYLYGPNEPPAITSLVVSETQLQPGGTADLDLIATDVEGDEIRYRWKAEGGALNCSSETSCTWTAPTRSGLYNVTARVRDASHKYYISRNVLFTVGVPDDNLVVSLEAMPSEGLAPLTTTLTAVVSGEGPGRTDFVFYCDRDDPGTEINPGWDEWIAKRREEAISLPYSCTYYEAGTYIPKVVARRGKRSRAAVAEARSQVVVTGPTWQARVFNADHDMEIVWNGTIVGNAPFCGTSGLVSLPLQVGDNTLEIVLNNDAGTGSAGTTAATWAYEVIRDGDVVASDACGTACLVGCNDEQEFPVGEVFRRVWTINGPDMLPLQ